MCDIIACFPLMIFLEEIGENKYCHQWTVPKIIEWLVCCYQHFWFKHVGSIANLRSPFSFEPCLLQYWPFYLLDVLGLRKKNNCRYKKWVYNNISCETNLTIWINEINEGCQPSYSYFFLAVIAMFRHC